MQKNIVIVGAGFAGLYTAKYLEKRLKLLKSKKIEASIALIDQNNYFTFTPLLHEVASGGLERELILHPIREAFGTGVSFINSKVERVHLGKNFVMTSDKIQLPYDYLVLATGSVSSLKYDVLNTEIFKLKTVNDAYNIKSAILTVFERKQNSLLNPPIKVVIVGGGPTGVELVAELAEYMHGTLARLYKHVGPGQNQILLLNSAGHLLGSFDKRLGERIEKYLVQKLNVKVINNSKIISIEDFVIKSSNGEIRGADVIIDASGVRAMYPDLIPAIDTDEKNNIITDDFLRIPEYPNVYALGDVGQFYKLAQTAVNQAEYAAKSIVNLMLNKQPKQYTFKPKGFLLSLGKNYAIGSLFNVLIFGKPVWFLWRTIYLFKVLNSRHRIKIALNWTLNLFSDRDTTNI